MTMPIKLRYVVFYTTLQRLEATVEERDGKLRRIQVAWQSKDSMPVPTNWFEMVESEWEFQRNEEADRAKGRRLPFC